MTFVGQQHIWHPNSLLWNLVHSGHLKNVLFWGPAGSGKTTLAKWIVNKLGIPACQLSSATCSVQDLRQAFAASQESLEKGGEAHILFLDEIHRLNKNQQDVLLPFLESGQIRFIAATTENPGFSVNKALLSRCLVFSFRALAHDDIAKMLQAQLLSWGRPNLAEATIFLNFLAQAAQGDGRSASYLCEAFCGAWSDRELLPLSEMELAALMPDLPTRHDRAGDTHYDILSAFIKSMRASKTQASLYYLARLIQGGEPATVIARRMLILASEDIGNAHPFALVLAQSTFAAVHQLGYPEARIPLSQCCIYLCEAPKSNRSYLAIDRAIEFVNATGSPPIPLNLTNAHQAFDKSQGRGASYINPHEASSKAATLPYFPPGLQEPIFYEPGAMGLEQRLHDTPKYPHQGPPPKGAPS